MASEARTGRQVEKKTHRAAFSPISAEETYLMVATPALDATSSCEPVPLEQPIAPINLPPSTIGMPPRDSMIVVQGHEIVHVVILKESRTISSQDSS